MDKTVKIVDFIATVGILIKKRNTGYQSQKRNQIVVTLVMVSLEPSEAKKID